MGVLSKFGRGFNSWDVLGNFLDFQLIWEEKNSQKEKEFAMFIKL